MYNYNMPIIPAAPLAAYIAPLAAGSFTLLAASKDLGVYMLAYVAWILMFWRVRPDLIGIDNFDFWTYPMLTILVSGIAGFFSAWAFSPSKKQFLTTRIFGDDSGRYALEVPLLAVFAFVVTFGVWFVQDVFDYMIDAADAETVGIILIVSGSVFIVAVLAVLAVWEAQRGFPGFSKGFTMDMADEANFEMRMSFKYALTIMIRVAGVIGFTYLVDISIGWGMAAIAIFIAAQVLAFFLDSYMHANAREETFWYSPGLHDQDELVPEQDKYISRMHFIAHQASVGAYAVFLMGAGYIGYYIEPTDVRYVWIWVASAAGISVVVSVLVNIIWSEENLRVSPSESEMSMLEKPSTRRRR